jgi:chromate reductase
MPRPEPGHPRILLFPGSLRRDSHQRRLVGHFLPLIEGRCQPDILEAGEMALPLFNQDLEQEPSVIAHVEAVHRRFAAADGFIVAPQEYNGHVSPYLKNTVDWLSRLSRIDPRFSEGPFRFEAAFADYIAETLATFCRLTATLKMGDSDHGCAA